MKKTALMVTFALCSAFSVSAAQSPQTKPDNTRTNREPGQTADQQGMNKQDRELTQQVRRAVMDEKAMSTYAHNIKIISRDGTVTLRGPVRSEEEKAAIEAKAKDVAGVTAVDNQLTVEPKK